MNVGGAFDRPIAADIWKTVQAKMENPDSELDIAIQNRGYYSSVLWNICLHHLQEYLQHHLQETLASHDEHSYNYDCHMIKSLPNCHLDKVTLLNFIYNYIVCSVYQVNACETILIQYCVYIFII